MPTDTPLHIAQQFARALDREDYATAARMLEPACTYEIRGATIHGAAKIIGSYRQAGDWASAAFDEIRYESAVRESADGSFRIRFVDLTRHGDLHHRHECEQVVEVSATGLVTRIRHVDLPGERERLDAFLAACGIERGDGMKHGAIEDG
jgi:limonene-1,2-epoxide hydrolase